MQSRYQPKKKPMKNASDRNANRPLLPALGAGPILSRVWQALLVLPLMVAATPHVSSNTAPLRLLPDDPHYFQSPAGQPLLLIGDYTWGVFSDTDYDYKAMFDTLQAHGLNFARVWLWWGCEQFPPPGDSRHLEPFLRPGPGQAHDGRPKYDLTQFNPAFFERLRDFCAAARERGIFLQLVTMDAWMLKHPHLWQLHAFHRDNNVNGADGDPRQTGTGTDSRKGFCSLGNPKALEFQKAYLRKLVDTLNDFDNVLIEIANENFYSQPWELRLCEFVHDCEKSKPNRHLVMPMDLLSHIDVVQTWDVRRVHAALLEKRRLRQPLLFDTDWTITQNDDEVRKAAWTAVLSGGHFNYMDDSFQTDGEHHGDVRGTRRAVLHRQIGHLAAFVRQMRFWEMQPDDGLVTRGTAFALGSTNQLAAYLPVGGRVTLDLSALTGQLEARWFEPRGGRWHDTFSLAGGRAADCAAPSADADWALLVRCATNSPTPLAPAPVRATVMSPSSVQVVWPVVAGAAGYKVFRDGTEVAETVLPGYTDFGLTLATRYAYAVAAFDLHRKVSPQSLPPVHVTTPARPALCQVDLGTATLGERIAHVMNPDGDTRAGQAGGRDCREPARADDHYFYFAIEDSYLFNEVGLTCRLEVSYFDEAGFIEPQFDSASAAYTSARRIALRHSGEWKTDTWTLTNCRFANRQNAGADFRLFVGTNRVRIASVKLSPVAEPAGVFGVHPLFPKQFVYGRQPFFFVGKSAFALVDADWKAFIDEAHKDGFTVLRVWLGCPALTKKHGRDHFQRNQAAGDVWPFGGTPEQPDFARFNEDYFHRLDALLAYMETKGMVAELTLFTGGDFWPGGPLAWDEVKQRYVQFVLDRYRDQPNLYYEIANEYYSAEQQAFVLKVGDFIWERDKAHLVTASAGNLPRFIDQPWYRLHNFHPSRGRNWWTRVYDEVLLPARQARLPVVNDEPMGSRAADDKEEGYPGRDVDAAHHRMNFWITALGGGHVTFHSHKGINALAGSSPGQEFVRPLREFFAQTQFWELKPAPERVEGGTACVAASASELVAYLPAGRRVTLDWRAPGSPLTARWFNPREGKFGSPFAVQGLGQTAFQAPDEKDWALLLQKSKAETE